MEPGHASAAVGGAGTLVNVIGSIIGGNQEARANRLAARNSKRAAKFEAAQLTQAAGQERASSQRVAIEERRRARLASSSAVARAAASGAGASDPTVLNIIGDLAAEGEYNALSALFSGEESARGLEMAAAGRLFEGKSEAQGYNTAAKSAKSYGYMNAGGHMLSGVASFYEKYGGDEDLASTPATPAYRQVGFRPPGIK